VREICLYLHTVYVNTDQKSYSLVQQAISTLVELGMGDIDNQVVLFDAKGMCVRLCVYVCVCVCLCVCVCVCVCALLYECAG
jgi:hypothetical protein